jgi:hypothetical protein
MPFKSRAQQAYLFAKKPEIAEEFAEHTSESDYKKLPKHATKDKKMKHEKKNEAKHMNHEKKSEAKHVKEKKKDYHKKHHKK